MSRILYIIAAILVVLWLIFFVGKFVTGGLIHILLVIAVIMIVINIFTPKSRT